MTLPTSEQFIPHLAFDSVIFGFSGDQLKILLMEYHNTGWLALPGGFIGQKESLDEAVKRGLRERTNLNNIFLEQFHTYGEIERHQPEVMAAILKANGYSVPDTHWLLQRFVTVAYYALINYNDVILKADFLSDTLGWYAIETLPDLILDHNQIVKGALNTLRANLERKLIGANLLPDKFTIKELQQVHEAILGVKLHRVAFQRKILAMDLLERHEKRFTGHPHKAPFLYSFKADRYFP